MYYLSKLELNRNDPCQCGSGLKYKHCCLKMHQERKRWEGLENNLRESITEYWQEFHENDLYDAINIYGKIIDKNTEVTERRLFLIGLYMIILFLIKIIIPLSSYF